MSLPGIDQVTEAGKQAWRWHIHINQQGTLGNQSGTTLTQADGKMGLTLLAGDYAATSYASSPYEYRLEFQFLDLQFSSPTTLSGKQCNYLGPASHMADPD